MSQPAFLPELLATDQAQWVAESIQLINWGGFHGHTSITLDPQATLISGASGTGKSTVLDAYLALMMPSDVSFNGASNDATAGRARNPEQRNLLSYLRGKTDDSREADSDPLTEKVLRGGDSATWGAVALTLADGAASRLTALRIYYVPRGATASRDIAMKMCTIGGRLDLRELEPLAAAKFDRGTLQARWPSIEIANTYTEFAQRLFDKLGIGASGDGANALRLLARIQAGRQVRTVDGLFKSMVLERPATYEAADTAVRHFDDLNTSYEEMRTAAAKQRALARLPELWDARERALTDERTIDTFGAGRRGDTPFELWRLRTLNQLLGTAIEAAISTQASCVAAAKQTKAARDQLKNELTAVREEIQAAGGDAIERLQGEIAEADATAARVQARRESFLADVAVLGLEPTDTAGFAAAQDAAGAFLTSLPGQLTELAQARTRLRDASYPVEKDLEEVTAERSSLDGRDGRVPFRLHRARLDMAAAAGIDPADLPFVAELLDIAPGERVWRTAIEITLHSVARVLLVDERRLRQLSHAIDPVALPVRVQFEGVALRPFTDEPGDARRVSGKLQHKDSPFSGWVRERVRRAGTDHLCVTDPADLDGDGPRVTRNGQTRNGRRGAHGGQAGTAIIGFSSAERIAELDADIKRLTTELAAFVERATALDQREQDLRDRENAHRRVRAAEWRDIDLHTALTHLAAKRDKLDELLAASDILAVLTQRRSDLERDLVAAEADHTRAGDRRKAAEDAYARLCEQSDGVVREIGRIEDDTTVTLTDDHSSYLDHVYAEVGRLDSVDDLERDLPKLRARLAERTDLARRDQAAAARELTGIFEQFHARWPHPNRGVGLESYPDYHDILTTITGTGLAERRQEWRRRLSGWSGQDLVPLAGAFDSAHEEIRSRLDPINDVLATLPFGPHNDRLSMALRVHVSEDVTRFRRQLNHLASGVTEDLDEERSERRFEELRSFIALLRPPAEGARPSPQRDACLDVRKHVEITAVRKDQAGNQRATYASLGGKSGGEAQELMAFVVGAALRYQLGDADRRPRYAPVFLDEGFIKSDSEFAGRSVQAWKKLGFQLIVSAPLDKVTALEPSMSLILAITKSAQGYSHVTTLRAVDSEPLPAPDRTAVPSQIVE